jgi:hypothetical protein
MMIQRLLEVEQTVNCLMEEASQDTLATTEWKKLEEMQNLLAPFKQHTDILQTDCQSLSSILPSLMDLECHLQDFKTVSNKAFITSMLTAFKGRFSIFLDPENEKFNALPAAACLLDPTVAAVLLTPEMRELLESAKRCIVSLDTDLQNSGPSDDQTQQNQNGSQMDELMSPALKRFRFLAAKFSVDSQITSSAPESIQSDLVKYILELRNFNAQQAADPMDFWKNRRPTYNKLAPVAEDILTAPASQAFVERIFSVCGLLTAGRRNRMEKSLETRVFLKINREFV